MDAPFPKNTRVAKINSRATDTVRDGALGRVIEAIGPTTEESPQPGLFGYTVMWDALPGASVFIAGSRIRALAEP
jgi:hypothetical protein